jgi:hypothetical protein
VCDCGVYRAEMRYFGHIRNDLKDMHMGLLEAPGHRV